MRLAVARPGSVVVTLESNPVHAVVARCIVGYAGLSGVIDVRVGHSEDVLPHLAAAVEEDGGVFDLVFFDQRGSRYAADLAALRRGGLLADRAVVVADNVLKPGAPEFLWEVLRSGCFHTQVVSVSEYAMPGVEDWMSLSVHLKQDERGAPPLPRSLRRMEWEADQIRSRAERFPGVSFEEWASFAARMREALAVFGIGPSAERTTSSRS
ncbi:unnamed protein product [Prorocentrum cordatum]|uniref:catechol O-methyltransferase n=1 Tax=Prorocentrum cordatum TaxID=2364126 RepID=A0ABN9SKZ4_9DINO|nr:unnamed protein product [Polarella glacialis]